MTSDPEAFYFAEPTECELGHEWQEYTVKWGEDADGNRGTYVTYNRCKLCGEER